MNLKELAKHLSLSQTTISRALNGYAEVGEATRIRVHAEAQRLGYSPNAHARRLATGRANAIGHVFPTDRSVTIDPLFADFIAGASEVYAAHGFDAMIHASGQEDELSVYRRYAQAGAVDAVVVLGPRIVDERITLLKELGLPFIVHGRQGDSSNNFGWLDVDNLGAFYRATKLLVDFGHRRVALLNALEHQTFAYHRRQGYERALQEGGIKSEPSTAWAGAMTEENGYLETRRLLALDERPTALLMGNMLLVSGAMRAIHERGLIIGKDISLIAHDDGLPFLNAEGLTPALTTTTSSIRSAGGRVAELLLAQIENPESEMPNELWNVDLIVRGSTGPAPR